LHGPRRWARRDMDSGDNHYIESLIKACDEMLAYHERAGSHDCAAARQVRAKRADLHQRLAEANGNQWGGWLTARSRTRPEPEVPPRSAPHEHLRHPRRA
jgi:hypothetical protein